MSIICKVNAEQGDICLNKLLYIRTLHTCGNIKVGVLFNNPKSQSIAVMISIGQWKKRVFC